MRVDDAKRWLKILAEKEVHVAPLFVGPMGIGKSDIVKQVTNELGLGFIDLRLAQMEPGDLIGIPYRDGDRTSWAKPEWFPKEGTKGILHLDECLPGRVQILTDKGRRSIADIYQSFQDGEEINIKSFNDLTKSFEFKKVTMAWNKGKKDVIALRFNNTKTLVCTPNHPVLTEFGYKAAQDLIPGNKIVAYIESKGKSATPALNSDQLQVAYGSILGDGCFCHRLCGSRYLSVIHGKPQKDYLEYKASLFNANVRKIEKNGIAQKPAYTFHTRLIAEFFGKRKRDIKQLALKNLDLKGLAIWYMDDGNKSQKSDSATLHTEGWNIEDTKFAVERLCAMGYECHLQKRMSYQVIYITANGFRKMSKDIAQYIHPIMRYKLIEEDKHTDFVSLNNKFLAYGYFIFTKFCEPPNLNTDGTKRYVYDLEVEDNHNFVVVSREVNNGVVVHNCNRAPNDVRQAVFQLIWDRKLHRFTLPDGWLIVSSINPSSNGEYQVEELDRAFLRRFCVLLLNPTVDSWMNWANREGKIANDITGFIGTHKDMLFESETFDLPVKRNPAGWSEVNKCRDKQALPQDLEFEIISGFVGKEAAAAFIKYLDANYERPVNGEEVLNNYKDVREKILKQRKKADEMYVTIKQIIGISEAAKKLTKKQMENLVSFIDDLNADTAAMLVHEMPSDIISALVKEGQKNGDDRILKVGKASRSAREDR